MSRVGVGLLIVVSLTVSADTNRPRTYYVSAAGDDSNSGFSAKPWRSIEKVNAMRFAPGDTILFHAGDVFKGNLVLDRRSRTSAQRAITIGSYGGAPATIAAGNGTAVLVKDLGGIIVRDLVVVGAGAMQNSGFGIDIRNSQVAARLPFVRVESVDASGFRWAGIYVGGPSTSSAAPGAVIQSGFRDVRISNCSAHDNLYYGIHISGPYDTLASTYANEDVVVSDATAHHNSGDPLYTTSHSGSGILIENTDRGLIDRCVAFENGAKHGSLAGGPVGIWAHNANRIVIQSSISYRNRTSGSADGGGFDFDGGVSNSIMQYNLSFENDGPGYLVWSYQYAARPLEHIVIRYNISSGDARKNSYGGIHVGGEQPVRDIDVYRNTVVTGFRSAKAAWIGGPPHARIRLRNNLLVTTGAGPLVEIADDRQDVVFEGNAYWAERGAFAILDHGRTYTSLSLWRASAGQEMADGRPIGIDSDPRLSADSTILFSIPSPGLVDWYRPSPGSPLINGGVDIGANTGGRGRRDIGAQDVDRNRREQLTGKWTRP